MERVRPLIRQGGHLQLLVGRSQLASARDDGPRRGKAAGDRRSALSALRRSQAAAGAAAEAAAAETEHTAAVEAAGTVAGQTGPALAAGTVDVLLFCADISCYFLQFTLVNNAERGRL